MEDLRGLREARAFWVQNRWPEALRSFHRIVRQHPDHLLALIDASRVLGSMYHYGRAEALLARALERGGDRPEIQHLVAQSLRLIRRPRQAQAAFEKLARLPSPPVDAHLELALLLERQGCWGKALEQVEARLRRLAGDPEGLLVQGRLLHRLGDTPASQRLLREVAGNAKVHWLTRSRACHELARVCDAAGDYEQAWTALGRGKSLLVPHAQPARLHRDRVLPNLDRLAGEAIASRWTRERATRVGDSFDGDALENTPSRPTVLLTGLPRTGSTLLEQILATHSRVAAGDEWDVFPRLVLQRLLGPVGLDGITWPMLETLPESRRRRLAQLYRDRLAAGLGTSIEDRVVVDKNPSLLPLVPLYKRLLPDSRVLVTLRDPRDTLVSNLMTCFSLNDFSVDFLSLPDAVARTVHDFELGCVLRDWLGNDWLECRYESLVADVRGTLAPILAACGLEWEDAMARHHAVDGRPPVFAPTGDRASQPPDRSAVGRWVHYREQLQAFLEPLHRLSERLGYPVS